MSNLNTETASIDANHSQDSTPYQGDNKLVLSIFLGVITFWLFAQSIVNIVPSIMEDVTINKASLNLAISLAALFSGCFSVIGGGLADRFGSVKLTQTGFALSIIGCLCLIFADSMALMVIGRIAQGLSAACIMPATLSLVRTYFDGENRQRVLSFWAIGSWGGSGLCSLFGGAIATYWGWRWIFIISIVCAGIGMILMSSTPENKAKGKADSQFDYLGLFTFLISLLSLNIIITKGNILGWGSTVVLALFFVFIISTTLFFKTELKKKSASFFDFSIFKNRSFSGVTLSNLLLNSSIGTLYVSSVYTQQGRDFTAFQSGMLTIGYLVAVLSMIRVGEKLLQKLGARKPMIWGVLMAGFGIAMMAFTSLDDNQYSIMVLIGYIFMGLGLGFYATPSVDTAITNSPDGRIGVSTGIFKMTSALGGAFGLAISATVYTELATQSPEYAAQVTLLMNAGLAIASSLPILFMVQVYKTNTYTKSIN